LYKNIHLHIKLFSHNINNTIEFIFRHKSNIRLKLKEVGIHIHSALYKLKKNMLKAVKLSVILILLLKCIELKKDLINVSLLFIFKPSKTTSFH